MSSRTRLLRGALALLAVLGALSVVGPRVAPDLPKRIGHAAAAVPRLFEAAKGSGHDVLVSARAHGPAKAAATPAAAALVVALLTLGTAAVTTRRRVLVSVAGGGPSRAPPAQRQ